MKNTLYKIVIFAFLLITLCSCAKTPTQNVIGEHINLVDSALAGLEKDPSIERAKESLKTCRAGLVSAEQSYKAEIATCKAKTDYWRLSSAGLAVALCVAIYLLLKRRF